MARAHKIVTISAEGRDKGKSFFVLEMPPRKAEKWATRALLAIGKAGHVDVSPELNEALGHAGMAGFAALGVRALTALDFADAEPLLDEMMDCVTFVPNLGMMDQVTRLPITRPLREEDIEEVGTILTLRSEIMEVHLGFSIAAFLSRVGSVAKARFLSSITPTSPPSSEE